MKESMLFPLALVATGLISVVFTVWNFLSLRRHLNQFRRGGRPISTVTDDRYFELRSKQEYLASTALVIVGLLTFFGYHTIQTIKDDLSKEVDSSRLEITRIKVEAQSALAEFQTLRSLSGNYADTVTDAIAAVSHLRSDLSKINRKNIIQQNIYIVERLDLSHKKKDKHYDFTVFFHELKTISGEKLPPFKMPPSIVVAARDRLWPLISEITPTSFKINIENSVTFEDIPDPLSPQFDLWINSKP